MLDILFQLAYDLHFVVPCRESVGLLDLREDVGEEGVRNQGVFFMPIQAEVGEDG